jgi:hypothetical protein
MNKSPLTFDLGESLKALGPKPKMTAENVEQVAEWTVRRANLERADALLRALTDDERHDVLRTVAKINGHPTIAAARKSVPHELWLSDRDVLAFAELWARAGREERNEMAREERAVRAVLQSLGGGAGVALDEIMPVQAAHSLDEVLAYFRGAGIRNESGRQIEMKAVRKAMERAVKGHKARATWVAALTAARLGAS